VADHSRFEPIREPLRFDNLISSSPLYSSTLIAPPTAPPVPSSKIHARHAALVRLAGAEHVRSVEAAISNAAAAVANVGHADSIAVTVPLAAATERELSALAALYHDAGWTTQVTLPGMRVFSVGNDGTHENADRAVGTLTLS
jgi:hypothetical protein